MAFKAQCVSFPLLHLKKIGVCFLNVSRPRWRPCGTARDVPTLYYCCGCQAVAYHPSARPLVFWLSSPLHYMRLSCRARAKRGLYNARSASTWRPRSTADRSPLGRKGLRCRAPVPKPRIATHRGFATLVQRKNRKGIWALEEHNSLYANFTRQLFRVSRVFIIYKPPNFAGLKTLSHSTT